MQAFFGKQNLICSAFKDLEDIKYIYGGWQAAIGFKNDGSVVYTGSFDGIVPAFLSNWKNIKKNMPDRELYCRADGRRYGEYRLCGILILSAKITSEKPVLQRLCYTAIVRQRANKKIRRTEK